MNEAIRSLMDTLNHCCHLLGLREAERPVDERYAFGHVQKKYSWNSRGALGVFSLGAGLGLAHAWHKVSNRAETLPVAISGVAVDPVWFVRVRALRATCPSGVEGRHARWLQGARAGAGFTFFRRLDTLAAQRIRRGRTMAKVSMSTQLAVAPETLWSLIGGFNALPEWHPAVEKSEVDGEGVGSTRTLSLVGGGTVVERLDRVDDDERVYTYSITNSPLPISNYTATIRVREQADGSQCVVEWSSEFEPSGAPEGDAVSAIQGIYQAGLENLKKMYGL